MPSHAHADQVAGVSTEPAQPLIRGGARRMLIGLPSDELKRWHINDSVHCAYGIYLLGGSRTQTLLELQHSNRAR
jgi:hypothetical protein